MDNLMLRLEDGKLSVRFLYNADLVKICRARDGLYDYSNRKWLFPLMKLPLLLQDLQPFQPDFDQAISKQLVRMTQQSDPVKLQNDLEAYRRFCYAHQIEAASFLLSNGLVGVISSEVGTGKSRSVIVATEIGFENQQLERVLLLCPKSVLPHWEEEWAQINPDRRVHRFNSTKKLNFPADAEVLLCSYSMFRSRLEVIKPFLPDLLIADELHIFKSKDSSVSKAVRSIPALYRIGISGTLLPKTVEDLWNPFDWVYPGFLGSYPHFYDQHVIWELQPRPGSSRKYKSKLGYKNLTKLKKQIAPAMIRHLREDVLPDLPDTQFTIRYVEMTAVQERIYKALKQEAFYNWEALDQVDLWNALVKHTRLHQAANNPALFEEAASSIKLDELDSFVEEMDEEMPMIIWSQWHGQMDALMEKYGDEAVYLDGRTSAAGRDDAIKKFQRGGVRYFCGNPAACGTGVTLTVAPVMVYLDRSYSALDRYQSLGRNNRIGQRASKLYVVDLITAGTVDALTLRVVSGDIDRMLQVQGNSSGNPLQGIDLGQFLR